MGGALTLATAVREADDIACAAPFYGIPPEQLAQMKHVKVPIQGHYGDKDKAKGFSDPAVCALPAFVFAISFVSRL